MRRWINRRICSILTHDWDYGRIQNVVDREMPGMWLTMRFKTCQRCGDIKRKVISAQYDPSQADKVSAEASS